MLLILEQLSASIDTLSEQEFKAKLPTEIQIDQLLMELYKWFIGSGRVILFTEKIKQAYRSEMTKGSPYFNLEVDFSIKIAF